MPQEGFRSAIYRSLATCNDPKGVVTCSPIRRPKSTEEAAMMSRRRSKASEDVNSPASFQLAEVSRGARKLNDTIERWSSGDRGGSNDMAKELLRGAMDLQGSLVMLGKLQEASKFMARLKHGETSPEQQKPRLSFGGDSTEELKKVIRESLLVKQRRSFVSYPEKSLELASASNSATSTSCESHLPVKGPNLIAKLMGLGDYPSAAEKPKRLVYNTDTNTRPRRERRSLREFLERARFEGALRGDDPFSDESLPPIVLMKPMRVPKREQEHGDDDDPLCVSREMLVKLRKSNEIRPDLEPLKEAPLAKTKATSRSMLKPPRASSPASHEKQRSMAAEKRGEKAQIKVHKKPSPPASEAQAIDRRNSVKTRKTSSEANAPKNQIISGQRRSLSPNKPSTVKRAEQIDSSIQKKKSCVKKEKPANKSTEVKLVVADEISRVSTNPKSQEEDLSLSESNIGDVTPERILCEAKPSTPCLNHDEEEASTDIVSDKRLEQESNLKALLLSSLSFRNRAEELFDLDFDSSQTSSDNFDDPRRIAGLLLVDCAMELVERLSLRTSQSAKLIRRRISLETVAEEICDEIEALRSYNSDEGLVAVELVYAMLERDVTARGGSTASGMWDSGWNTAGVSPEEAERVVADVAKLVLSGLIEEIFFC